MKSHPLSCTIFFFFNYASQKQLAQSITTEQGKTTVDAEGDVLRGLRKSEACAILNTSFNKYFNLIKTEVVEHCCSITSLQLGETMSNIAKDMDTMSFRAPLGVCAGITPFNFPGSMFTYDKKYHLR